MLTLAMCSDCEAPSSSKSLLQVHHDSETVKTSSRTASGDGACSYDVYIGRSDWGWDQYWAKVIVSAPKGESFHFDGCDTESTAGQACHNGMGIHVLRDSKGNQVLRVISNECTDECLYTLDIYRGGPDNFEKWFQKNDAAITLVCLKLDVLEGSFVNPVDWSPANDGGAEHPGALRRSDDEAKGRELRIHRLHRRHREWPGMRR
eukprot:Skav226775  [mRNA]  locus=scaffold8:235632:238822:- [translate_table: standard]